MNLKRLMEQYAPGSIEKLEKTTEIEFLCGVNEWDRYETSQFDTYIADVELDFSEENFQEKDFLPSAVAEGYWFAHGAAGVYLLNTDHSIVGYYYGPTLCVRTEDQGKGLGAELVLRRSLDLEDPPQSGYDEAMYSKAGLRAHISAKRWLDKLGAHARLVRLARAEDQEGPSL